MLLRLVVFLLIAGVAVVAAAIGLVLMWRTIGWLTIPVAVVLLVAAAWGIKVLVGRLVMKLFEAPFRAKGAVLRDAVARVNEVKRVGADGAAHVYQIDVTIVPAPGGATPFRSWDPHELILVPHGTPTGTAPADSEDGAEITKVEFWHGGRFVEELPEEPEGDDGGAAVAEASSRLRLHAKAPTGMKRAAFRYYFEVFGDVPLT